MNRRAVPRAMAEELPKVPTAFLVVTFTVAILIGILVIYLGISGKIGGPIP
jgi:F0F1-type ATP synthase membrane subunit a